LLNPIGMLPLFSNTLGDEELKAVEEVFESRWLARGKQCEAFEDEFAKSLGVAKTLLFNCCTSATYAALSALKIGPGDEVIIPSIQFVGVANAVVEVGAIPVFADIDMRTLNILPSEIERLRTTRTRAVFLLHYGGHPADISAVRSVCDGLLILEDAANAIFSTWNGQACGTLGDAGVWSFDAMKILVMSDGGALWLRSAEAMRNAEVFRYFGFPPEGSTGADLASVGRARWWEFDVEMPSGRFISNDLLAAIGRVQLRKLSSFIERRKSVWLLYKDILADVDQIDLPPEPLEGCTTSYYFFWVQTERRDELAVYLYRNGVYTSFRYHPLHRVKVYGNVEQLPNADLVAARTLCLPLHQNLSDEDVEKVTKLVHGFFGR